MDFLSKSELLDSTKCREVEAEAARKRVAWLHERYGETAPKGEASPRRAYEIFLLEYLGLPAEQVPVVSESPDAIEWLSFNPCSTLAACVASGHDTRQVCRACFEKPVQAMVSLLDPQLRFSRSYEEIRPYAPHCREKIVRLDFEQMMALAVEEGRISRAEGNKGYGAVLVMEGKIVARAHDTTVTEHDASRHAELNAIREASRVLGDGNLCGAVLFSSCEPCPMCASAAAWANVTTVVYGASIEETARLGRTRILVDTRHIVDHSPFLVEVIGGVLHEECLALYA